MKVGTTELIVILIVVLIIFGPKNLPKLGKMFGKTMKGFKDGMDEADPDADDEDDEPKKTSSKKKAAKKTEEDDSSDEE